MKRKLVSLFLCLVMVVGLLPQTVLFASAAYSGTCGENLTWTLDDNGTLTISGSGAMEDYSPYSAPWYSYQSKIKTVVIEDSVTSIGDSAFDYCYCLTEITVDADNPNYSSLDGNLYNKNRTTLIQYATGKSETSFTIPDSVTSIGDSAFYNCDGLTEVTIPDSVTSIGDDAFYNCSALTSVTIGNGVTSIGSYAFFYCGALTSVTIGNGVTSIGKSAFSDCDALTSITIPDSVTSIGKSAFSDCDALTEITVDADNPNYSSLDGNLYNKNRTTLIQYAIGKSETSFTIPDSVTSIGDKAFERCYALTEITIPDSVTSIGERAFYYCSALTEITIPDSVTSIGDEAFYYCDALTSVTIGNGVTSIGKSAFCDCDALTSITIPDSVTSIGDDAFSNCSKLTSITIPDSVTSIGRSAFYYCSKLTEVYYGGDENDRSKISIGSYNTPLTDATWYYITKYNVTISSVTGGVVLSDKKTAAEGETVTLTVTPNAGYEFVAFLVDGVAISGNTFTMPKTAVTVTAEFTAIDYAVTAGECENGSVSVDKETANIGDTVTVVTMPNAGYELSKILVNGKANSGSTFTMPAEDVVVTAEFVKKVYTIQTVQPEEGIVMVDKTSATFGEIVTVTTVPAIGYVLAKIKVNGTAIAGNQFMMPKANATVTAEFKLINDVRVSTVNGAQIRTTGAQGLRFISSIDKTSLDFDRVVEYGTILIPSADITDISELQIGATLNGHAVAKVPANFIYDETDDAVTFTAVITNVAAKNYAREYTARAYAIMDDGSVVYADTGASRSIYAVAKRGLENPNESDANKEIFQSIVDTVEGEN